MIPCSEFSVRHERRWHPPGGAEIAYDRRALRVWLVDDDKEFSSLLAGLLGQQGGIECSRYFPSAEAVLDALASEAPPDVILLDIDMGGLSGLDAIRPIKSLAGSTHVFMLTSFYDSQRRSRALRDGATDFLLKIDTVEKISKSIRSRQRQAKDELAGSPPGRGEFEPERDGSPVRVSANWPGRRAPEFAAGRFSDDDVTQTHPESGRRNVPWRSASSRLVRGVGYLRALLGLVA